MITTNFQPRRRSRVHAQSLTVAIIVLFLLLFLGGLFIALIVNNMRAGQDAAKGSAADKFAEAGLTYMDDQLTKSPEGADWRPVPFVADPLDTDGNGNYDDQDTSGNGRRNAEPLRTTDPDYDWLQPCSATGNVEPCGYSRVDFGGRTPSAGNLGGRALIKLVYTPAPGDANSQYIKLFAVGRAGIVDASDPTTFASSEGKGQRREKVGFKAIELTRFLRFITNRDNRSVEASLGATTRVQDSPFATPRTSAAPEVHQVESVYHGPIHSNAPLTFNGINRLLLNSQRGDTLTVSSNLNIPTTNGTQVLLTDLSGAFTNASVIGSNGAFNPYMGMVRDHAPQTGSPLRNVARVGVPTIDQSIGDNGLTRYRALTRDSEPMDARYVNANVITGLGTNQAGRIGWGSGFYLDNREDIQTASEALVGAYSPRANWIGTDTRWWNGDNRYTPPAVVITLTPRYMMIQRSATSLNRSFLRDNTGRRINQSTVIRYSGTGTGAADTAPVAGLPANVRKLEAYPAQPYVNPLTNTAVPGVWEGEYVVYAEGNIRIRGTAGGLDPETLRYYIRHLTVVSGANIYVDGNLLKDNLPANPSGVAAQVRGRSSIALLAKDYVVVNTTQFLTPGDNLAGPEASGSDARAIFMRPDSPVFNLRLTQGPAERFQANGERFAETNPDSRIAPSTLPLPPSIFLRHSAAEVNGATAVRLNVNDVGTGNSFFRFPVAYAWPNASPALTTLAMGGPTTIEPGVYFDHVFPLKDGVNNTNLLFPDTAGPYAGPAPSFGIDNMMTLSLDVSAGVPNQTDYRLSRFGVAPLDVRVEALIYAQDGSFFIIPGPWLNPDPNDTYEAYLTRGSRAGDNLTATGLGRIDPSYPFYGQPQDIRITLFGAIAENLPADSSDQGAWLEKWGWVPNYFGSTGLPPAPGYASQGAAVPTLHGPNGVLPGPQPGGVGTGGGSGIVYLYDEKLVTPYATDGAVLRRDEYGNTLPMAPRLPVAPGLLFIGETPGA
jgi:hypothetical protein